MKANIFKQKVKKQLWFLNKKEKSKLDSVLESVVEKHDNEHLNRPIAFSNQFLKEYVFKEKVVSSTQLFALLLGVLFTYIMLLGIFLFGFITSLTAVQYFIKPEVQLSTLTVILTFIGALLLVIVSLYLIRLVTGYFTKKLLEYKHNKAL
ncbi:SoxR reducing system RseC family protein [Staphylococcus saprophyticus]|uniref:SoxR reducing system RseC family protein n=1 Tax=Staphylococcus saprophyticus TaxID=29385 RepID=UPI0011A21E4D|nr:SoxR reducing system RseC family protein [Staphylococcus saprophyticus]